MGLYKRHSGIRRIPLGQLRVERPGRPYLTQEEFARLLDGDVVVEEKLDGHPEVLEDESHVFFCEDLRFQHSIPYSRVPRPRLKAPAFFVCYDIWIQGEERWAAREEKCIQCEGVGLPVALLVFEGRITAEEIPLLAARQSAFGEALAEGIVIKNLQHGLFGKFINAEFRQGVENAENWRRDKRKRNRLAV